MSTLDSIAFSTLESLTPTPREGSRGVELVECWNGPV